MPQGYRQPKPTRATPKERALVSHQTASSLGLATSLKTGELSISLWEMPRQIFRPKEAAKIIKIPLFNSKWYGSSNRWWVNRLNLRIKTWTSVASQSKIHKRATWELVLWVHKWAMPVWFHSRRQGTKRMFHKDVQMAQSPSSLKTRSRSTPRLVPTFKEAMTQFRDSRASTRFRCTRRTIQWLQTCRWWIWILLKTKETSLNWAKKEEPTKEPDLAVEQRAREEMPKVPALTTIGAEAAALSSKTPPVSTWAQPCKMQMRSSRSWTSNSSNWCKCNCKSRILSSTTS